MEEVFNRVNIWILITVFNILWFQGGVQVSRFWFQCVWLPTAARHLPSSEGLLQPHRKCFLSQHISDSNEQPRLPWLVLPGERRQNELVHRCVSLQLSCQIEYAFNPFFSGLHRDGDAHVYRWCQGYVWTRGVELPGVLWRVLCWVWCKATSRLGGHSLRGQGHRLSQQHHLQVNITWQRHKSPLFPGLFSAVRAIGLIDVPGFDCRKIKSNHLGSCTRGTVGKT